MSESQGNTMCLCCYCMSVDSCLLGFVKYINSWLMMRRWWHGESIRRFNELDSKCFLRLIFLSFPLWRGNSIVAVDKIYLLSFFGSSKSTLSPAFNNYNEKLLLMSKVAMIIIGCIFQETNWLLLNDDTLLPVSPLDLECSSGSSFKNFTNTFFCLGWAFQVSVRIDLFCHGSPFLRCYGLLFHFGQFLHCITVIPQILQ